MFYLWLWIMMFVLVCCVGAGGTYLQSRFRRRCMGTTEGETVNSIADGVNPTTLGPFVPPPYCVVPPRPPGYTAIVGSKEYGSDYDSLDKPPSYRSREVDDYNTHEESQVSGVESTM